MTNRTFARRALPALAAIPRKHLLALAVGTGLSVIVTGMVLPSLRSPTSRARSTIGRAAGLSA